MSSQFGANMFGVRAPHSSPRFIKLELALPRAQSMSHDADRLLKSFMLQSVHLDASVNEFASHGSLTFVFKNPIATPVEMRFAFPLMDGGAVVTGITTEWDGQRISSRVCETEKGKKDYSDAIAKGHTASLVEHAENDLFMWRVGGIPGGSTVTVVTEFCGPVTLAKKFGKKPQTEITLTLPAVVPPWYGRADVGDAALAFDTALQAPATVGGLALALPPFTATVHSHFVTRSLQAISVTSPTHGPPSASSIRSSGDGYEVSFRDLFKPPAGGKAATNLQMRWVALGHVPNMACVGRVLAGAGRSDPVTAGADAIVAHDAAATVAMEAAAKVLAQGPHAEDARALLDKLKTQQRTMEQVCGVLYSEQDGRQPERVHVTVLVDCSGSMYPKRIDKARKAVRALLTSLDPTSTFSVYLFGGSCHAVVLEAPARGPVFEATPENITAVTSIVDVADSMGGTELFTAVKEVMRNQVPADRRHNVMILTDGEVAQGESTRVKLLLAAACPSHALVGMIGIGNEVTRTTLRTVVEGGLGPQAIIFDNESDESIASIIVGSVNALISSQLRQVNWPGGKMASSQPHIQWNSSQVCVAWALYPEVALAPAAHAAEDEEWEVVDADVVPASGDATAPCSAPLVRWLGGASVSVTAPQGSTNPPSQLTTFLVTDEHAVKSMSIVAALARCRHPSCPRDEATKLALRLGFVCADADSVMVAISDQPTGDAPCASFGIAIPSQPTARPMKRCKSAYSPNMAQCFGPMVASNFAFPSPTQFAAFGAAHNQPPLADSFAFAHGPSSYGQRNQWLGPQHHAAASISAPPVPNCSPPTQFTAFGAAHNQPPVPDGFAFARCKGPSRRSAPMPTMLCSFGSSSARSPAPTSASDPSLLDILGALERASWSLRHPAVAAFLTKHLRGAAALLTSDAHATVAVIVVLRAKFKDSKAGWCAHVKRAAQSARLTLGDSVYTALKVSVVSAMGA